MIFIDEFHSFSTSAFAELLSEIRKYAVGLTLAHQHTHQADDDVLEALLGNVGSIMTFRIGVHDAPLFQRQFGTVSINDLINLPNYRTFIQLMVDGRRSKVFSAQTLPTY